MLCYFLWETTKIYAKQDFFQKTIIKQIEHLMYEGFCKKSPSKSVPASL